MTRVVVAFALSTVASAVATDEVSVYAAGSLRAPLSDLASEFERG